MATDPREAERSAESRRILDRVQRDAQSGGLLGRTMGRARDHIGAADADQSDRIEVWGTRIGRTIGAAALFVLVLWAASLVLSGT